MRRLYYIRPDCLNLHNGCCNFAQYKSQILFISRNFNPFGTFMKILEFNEPYKYVITTSINPIFRFLSLSNPIKKRKIFVFIVSEHVSLKSIRHLCENP